MTVELDHLVVAAATLDDGVRWCEATFGVTPGAGGAHALMGTHNRLLAIGSPQFPRSYFEIIAIDPAAASPQRGRRWFGLDESALQAALERGPRLVHWVARSGDLDATVAALRAIGADSGEPVAAARGGYRWRITLRDDGLPQCGGALPALIEWAGAHPADALAGSGVMLRSLMASGLSAPALAALGASAIGAGPPGAASLVAEFSSPRGIVTLRSAG